MKWKVIKKQVCLVLTALSIVGVTIALPVVAPLQDPKLTACYDQIVDLKKCIEQNRTSVYCCLSQGVMWRCTEVRWWIHIDTKTDYFRVDKDSTCRNLMLPCSPVTGICK